MDCFAQCGYPATLRTSKDYCIGTSLAVNSPHTLERIVWYKDGQPIDSALADQSIAATPKAIRIPGVWPSTDLASDEAGNIYMIDGPRNRIISWNPTSGKLTVIGSPPVQAGTVWQRLFVDHAGSVYLSQSKPHQVWKYSPGVTAPIIVATGQPSNYPTYGSGLYVDCQENVFVVDEAQSIVSRWAPGANSGTVVAGGNGLGTAPNQLFSPMQIRQDSLGNLYLLEGGRLVRWPAGSASSTSLIDLRKWASTGYCTDFWLDGKDTAYFISWISDSTNYTRICQWPSGLDSPRVIGSIPNAKTGSDPPQLTVDDKGNIFGIIGTDSTLYEFQRTSSINLVYTPSATGVYYAIVTDIRGDASMTSPLVINSPGAGTPAISISATALSTPVCTPITFAATPINPGIAPAYQWMVSGVKVGNGGLTYANNLFADSDQVYCIMTAQAGCQGTVTDTSNVIVLNIDPHGAASIKIAVPKDSICAGDSVFFSAIVANASNNPVFEWLLNGDSTGDTGSTYGGTGFSNGDVIACLITSDDVCGLAKSNSITLTVSTPPMIAKGEIITILHGHSQTLEPVITGDANNFSWTPGGSLSDSTIEDPVASPDTNTLYTLIVTAAGGCSATGTILVDVYTPLSVPGAFTPNGDGHNDVFYVLGGPVNSRVEEFAVFDRYGAEVFAVHGAEPGDPRFGWNGTIHGSPAPAGTYVYLIRMQFADGSRQLYKGTVVLIR